MLTILNRIRVRAGDCRVSLASVILGFVVLMFLSPVQDLLLEIRGLGPIIGFSAIMLLFWTIPVHNAAYRAIDNIPRPVDASFARSARAIDTYFPPVLGLSTLVIVLAATAATANSLDTVDGIEEVDAVVDVLRAIQICMAAACVVFIGYVAWRHRLVSLPSHSFVGNLLRALPPALGIFTLLLLVLAIIAPSEFAWRFGREDLLPVILGGWVPAFSYLALLSYRTGWPLIALTFGGLVVVSIFSGRFHDVRTYESDRWQAVADGRPDARGRQIPIEPAIKGWMTANGCEGKPAACPPVVLVAAEGGASRSAFYTATILGALLDTTRANPDDYYDFGRAIFAMSGVSGGALGVTITRTALALSDERGKQGPPCRHSDPTWFGDAASAGRDPTQSWRACLQLLAAGDYLSPTILGLVFRDGLAFLLSAVTKVETADRATLLEQAIEQHFNAIVHGERTPCGGAKDERGLCRPFGYLPAAAPHHWLPLLFLNAASVETGRQIIAADLDIGADSPAPGRCQELYPFSYSVFELLASGGDSGASPASTTDCTFPGLDKGEDVRLSTAAVMSARFPIVSPAGSLRNRADAVVERVVDGGYFDNTGLEPLMPLIPVLTEAGLHPLVLHLSNRPWSYQPGSLELPGRDFLRSEPRYVRLNPSPTGTYFTDMFEAILSPLQALNGVRSGHGERVEDAMMTLVANDDRGAYFSPRIYSSARVTGNQSNPDLCAEIPSLRFTLRNLSMSWWLSPVVQRVIDLQLCDNRDTLLLTDILKRLELHPLAVGPEENQSGGM